VPAGLRLTWPYLKAGGSIVKNYGTGRSSKVRLAACLFVACCWLAASDTNPSPRCQQLLSGATMLAVIATDPGIGLYYQNNNGRNCLWRFNWFYYLYYSYGG
jgi:hypothetical protein